MKFLKYLCIWVGIFVVLAFVAGYVYIRVEGKNIFERQLSRFFGQPVTISEIRYLLPSGIRVTNMKVRNILEAEDVRLYLRIPYLLERRFVVAKLELTDPVFHLVRHGKKKLDFGGVYLNDQEKKFSPEKFYPIPPVEGILIDFLSVKNGRVEVLDLAIDEPVKYEVSSIEAKGMKVVYPLEDENIKFDAFGVVAGAGSHEIFQDAKFKLSGKVNWFQRSMDATTDFKRDDGLSGEMTLKGKNNHLKANGRLKMKAEDREQESADEKDKGIKGVIAEALDATDSTLTLNFSFETKMDDFSLSVVDFNGLLDIPERKKENSGINASSLFGVSKPAGTSDGKSDGDEKSSK